MRRCPLCGHENPDDITTCARCSAELGLVCVSCGQVVPPQSRFCNSCGARLAETWSLPDTIIRCIRYHHEPEELPNPDPFVDAVHLADSVCLVMGVGGGDDGLAYRSSPNVMIRHNMSQSDLDLLGADLIAELRSVQALFAEQA